MRVRMGRLLGTLAMAFVAASGTSEACHTCRQTPCVLAPAPMPAYQCVTEMVPYTVNRVRVRTEFQEITETIMAPELDVTYVERQRQVCRPVFDVTYVERRCQVCRPVSETTSVTQNVTVCRPETTTQQVTDYVMQAMTQLVTVPVAAPHRCGHCGKVAPACGCATVAQTCYTPVPYVRDVQVTRMVPEVHTREVPVTTTHLVRETVTEKVPVRTCRMVSEVVTDRIPITNVRMVPKTVTRRIPYPVCETVQETRYRPVPRMVPVVPAPAYECPRATPRRRRPPRPRADAAPWGPLCADHAGASRPSIPSSRRVRAARRLRRAWRIAPTGQSRPQVIR